ncbi:phosphate acyltransferase PlsX [Nisaea acidiphila]|uniref:Phosphate acyltransferase n=1 Tax=Nisaea acidiphila TaxID=1862145 RepID=A0A9J7ARI5_9PROT|nr:phosphate acyltransferase PlsX [Nisaea acidiphila]UUX50219.1 phosphate acyltransferase PlsX [Nisaea acidiphila]
MVDGPTLALDAMGGDHAPGIVVRGADIALARMPDLKLILVGDEAQLRPLIENTKRLANSDFKLIHTDKAVGASEKPSVALRSGRNSSMRLAINQVADGEADGVVSAGNTGALMAMSKFVLRMCPGIERPAIASFFPTRRGETCMLDLGANVDCDSENLVQFALMGEIFSRMVLGLSRPKVGLLNVGSEEQKGSDAVRGAAAVLRETESENFEYVGFVEGDDITAGTVDVIVTDGFSGNIALKTAEGTSRMITQFLRDAFKSSWAARLGYLLCRGALEQMRKRLDPRRYNGAVFLGLNGISVKSHGGTDALGFANAVCVAADMCRYGFLEKVKEEIALYGDSSGANLTRQTSVAS